MTGGALTDWLNHQLAIRCINVTQITLGVLQLASLIVGRHGCEWDDGN